MDSCRLLHLIKSSDSDEVAASQQTKEQGAAPDRLRACVTSAAYELSVGPLRNTWLRGIMIPKRGGGKFAVDRVMLMAATFGLLLFGISFLHSELVSNSAIHKVLRGKEHRYAHYYTSVCHGLIAIFTLLFIALSFIVR